MIPRYYSNLESYICPGKVLVIYGPRQVGKTTLIRNYLETAPYKYRFDSGENISIQEVLGSQDFTAISRYVGDNQLIVIDEAQEIANIGRGLKIIVDQHPGVRIIATGSSSFDLARSIGEPLVGRKTTLRLYPIAQMELLGHIGNQYDLGQQLEDFLLYGSYPDSLNAVTPQDKIVYLTELVDSYLLKDILALDNIKSPKSLRDLLKLLALQVGNEVSLHELGQKLGWDLKTVERYLDLLEQCFVIVRLGGFSRNLRTEITRKSKYYFLDIGVRNALLQQFNALDSRNDRGALLENFLVVERLKYRSYTKLHGSSYFWRTHSQQEIDLVEDRDGQLYGYEFKWSPKKNIPKPIQWDEVYPGAQFDVVNRDNYLDFVA
ncbi:MAG TPA: ATP-binding protein [Candidatus Saccharibacteria bacterium]|nr:ATP-binding protein [Candidatus Saccharibacteria bacterium]HMR38174.1 ATP-binding protein [Candidatus Saccharibacteria bacterium]